MITTTELPIKLKESDIDIIKSISKLLILPERKVILQSIEFMIEKKIQQTKSKLKVLQEKYKVKTVIEFDNLYKIGAIPEESTWEDFQNFDDNEADINKLKNILAQLNDYRHEYK